MPLCELLVLPESPHWTGKQEKTRKRPNRNKDVIMRGKKKSEITDTQIRTYTKCDKGTESLVISELKSQLTASMLRLVWLKTFKLVLF